MTSTRMLLTSLAGILTAASWVMASFPGTDVYLPSVGRGGGSGGSQWYTAMWVHNPTASVANAQVFFLKRDQANPAPQVFNLSVPPGDTIRTDDAITAMFGGSGFGALRVVSDQLLLVNSRIYSKPQGGDLKNTVGQFFAAVPASFAIAAGQSTTLLGVYQTAPQTDSQFRYNFGFVETAGAAATVRVSAFDETGLSVGSKDYPLAAFEARQYNISDLLPGINSQNLRLTVEVLSGSGKVVAFGSGLANASNDPSTFEMSFRSDLLGGGGSAGAVVHDSSLSGDGTSSSPLAVANGGVTPHKLSPTGSTSGQVLTSSGSAVSWQNPGGFTLPYSGTVASTDPGFSVSNTTGTIAVRGLATSTAQSINYGGYFEAYGPSGRGVAGATNGAGAFGVYGIALGSGGRGVVGESSATGAGVLGKSTGGDGVVGQSETATKSGVYGVNTANGGYGVFGRNSNTGAVGYLGGFNGVWGVSSQGLAHGGYFEASGSLSAGVYGKSTAAYGYGGVFEATGSNAYGLLAVGPASGAPGAAAIFRGVVEVQRHTANTASLKLGDDTPLWAEAGSAGYAAEFEGRIKTSVLEITGGSDLSEQFDIHGARGGDPLPGMVVSIDPTREGGLVVSGRAYDRSVAGVVSGAGGVKPGMLMGQAGSAASGAHPVALSGRVYCMADASFGAIVAGDLLTTSETPGHAMKADDLTRAQGAVLGKAMTALPSGRGLVLVLVALQ